MRAQVTTVLRHRLLIQSLVSRELKARYRGSVLGFFWSFVNPLLLLLTYTVVFTKIMPRQPTPKMEPYYLFFFCGILPWTWFSSSLVESANGLIAGGNLIKKVLFPAEVLPVVTVLANLVHFLLGLPILLLFLGWEGRLGPAALLLPLPLTVHFRDLQNILGHVLHLWFFTSPILYFYGDVPGTFRNVLRLNPMSHILVSYQQILFEGTFTHGPQLALTGLLALAVFAFGAFLFDRLRDTFAEGV